MNYFNYKNPYLYNYLGQSGWFDDLWHSIQEGATNIYRAINPFVGEHGEMTFASIRDIPIIGDFMKWTERQGIIDWNLNKSPFWQQYSGWIISGIGTLATVATGGLLSPFLANILAGGLNLLSTDQLAKYEENLASKDINDKISSIQSDIDALEKLKSQLDEEQRKKADALKKQLDDLKNKYTRQKLIMYGIPIGLSIIGGIILLKGE